MRARSTAATSGSAQVATRSASPGNRWVVLTLLGIAQLMIVLDVTIVNIALPSAQQALRFSTDDRQWIITAYALSFGSLLLLGGKLGDLFGRKLTFIAGLLGFAIASALGGLAPSFAALVAARALQGSFGALLAPSAPPPDRRHQMLLARSRNRSPVAESDNDIVCPGSDWWSDS
jgi:predicted MFS family arabinose efflux permease